MSTLKKELYKTDENYDRLWKMRNVSDKLTTEETEMVWSQKLEAVHF
jgi:hypothetical protein